MRIRVALMALLPTAVVPTPGAIPSQTGGQVCYRTASFNCNYCPGEQTFSCIPDPYGPYKACHTEEEYCAPNKACLAVVTRQGIGCPQGGS